MSNVLKAIIATLIIIATAFLVYFGAFTPFYKSKTYLSTVRSISSNEVISINDLTKDLDKSLSFYSPVADRTIADIYTRFIRDLITDQNMENEILEFLIEHVESNAYYEDDININLYLASIHGISFRKTNQENYLETSEEYLLKAYEIGPTLPQVLEMLAINYTIRGEGEKLDKIAEEILELWPDHPAVQTN